MFGLKEERNNMKLLFDAARNGDKEAFEVLYKQYFTPVFRYIFLRVGDNALAEDLTQEVFLKIYNSLNKIKESNETELLKYFFTVARNTLIDNFRAKKIIESVDEDIQNNIPCDENSSLENYIIKEDFNVVVKYLAKLPDAQKEAIVLRFVEALDNSEISLIMNKSEENIRQLICRGLKKLRVLIGGL